MLQLDLHCHTPEFVVRQKRVTQLSHDRSRMKTQPVQENDVGKSSFAVHEAPPKDWNVCPSNINFKKKLAIAIWRSSCIRRFIFASE